MCGLAALALTLAAAPQPARAQWAVYDAKADVEAMLSAARQIESLANETRALANQARSLAASPYSHLAESSETLRDIGALARTVRGAASTLDGVQRQFANLYPDDLSRSDLAALGAERSTTARRTAEDLARTAAQLEQLARSRDGRLRGALAASDAAEGETAAIQSSTQMLSVLAEDLASLRTVLLAQSRLMAEGAARQAADRDAAIEARRRFWGRETATPAAPAFNPLSRARD
ncbi:conjugal transfer protein TrbJ [Brevundimonas sp.]|uniref:conjugal transfer protein TrbJ n=1 Tax=Brevundimonas sp. TaxID=1871086 RepID=UPI0028A175E1|nr:conjugal transfer protein TrbJ [Brevundimonas sp.]